jgi:hypothetical protein
MNKQAIIKEEPKLSPKYELAQKEIAKLSKSGLKQEVLNLLFKESIENELARREETYKKLDTRLQVTNENH